jgi:hypothetical protein
MPVERCFGHKRRTLTGLENVEPSLQNGKLNNLKARCVCGFTGTAPVKSRGIRLAMSSAWGNMKFFNNLVWRRQENKGLRNRRHTYKSNIETDFKWVMSLLACLSCLKTGYSGLDLINLGKTFMIA